MFDTILNTFGMVANVLPFDWVQTVLTVIGGSAVIASAVSQPNSQYARKAHKIINVLGFNFGKAKNKE